MTFTALKSAAVALAIIAAAAVSLVASTAAEARGGKPVYSQDYNVNEPLHGYSGHKGAFYCDYERIPKRVCKIVGGKEKCKVKGWTLRQTCR